MDASNAWTTKGTIDCTRRLDEYKETVSRLFPALPRDYVDTWSISKVDALALGYFLECYPRKVIVLDVGTSVGVSAFHFAGQPKVLRVIGVDPNPTLVDEVNDKSDMLASSIDSEPLRNLRVLEVAQAALAEFGDERQKIQLRVGTVGNSRASIQESSFDGSEKAEIPTLEPSDGVSLVAFVGGPHTKEGVRADLEAIFEKHPHAVAILDDCRGPWGPFVQAGAVNFMEEAQEKYHFQLFGDLGPSIATSDLGIVYPDMNAAKAKQALVEFSELFSERLDLLRLLRREEELIGAVSLYKEEADRLRTERTTLARRNAELEGRIARYEERITDYEGRIADYEGRIAHYSSRRYKLADALVDRTLQVPGIRRLVQRKPAQ